MRFFSSRSSKSTAATLRKSNEQPLAGLHHQEREPQHIRTTGQTGRRRAAGGVLAFLLFIAAGLSIAALVADSWHKYWFYVSGSGFRIRTGYFQWDSTDGARHSLKELARGVYIMGIISLCYTGVSALTAIICFFAAFSRRTSGKALFLWAQILSLTFAGVLIAFYIVTAIYEAKYLIPQTRVLSICHPDWAWCLAMGAAICWWLTSLVAVGLPSSRRHRESLPIVANGVYGARDIDTIAPLSSPKATDGAWTRADPAPELPPPKKRRGLFGQKSSGASVPNGAMSSAQPAATLPSAPVAEPASIGTRYSQWIQNSQPNRVPTRN